MDRISVQSSNVAEIGYDPSSMTLEVAFNDGNVYQYFDVPQVVFDEFIRADSKGKFLNDEIKGAYRYTRI